MAYSVSYAITQSKLAAISSHAITGIALVCAANAIGIPKLKAMPRYACGIAKNLFVNG